MHSCDEQYILQRRQLSTYTNYAGQSGDVGDLLHAGQEAAHAAAIARVAQLVEHETLQVVVDVEDALHLYFS